MGLVRAFTGSVSSYISDMWEDFIYCDALDNDTLIQKGHSKSSAGAGRNKDDNIITSGSRIAVNAGQTLIVVEDGKIVDFTAEQGGYVFNSESEPSAFCGDLGKGLSISFEQIGKRFAYGGTAGKDQRAYFVNTKEIMDTRFGFGRIPYRESEFGLTITINGFGIFSFRIVDPIRFYTNVSGNVKERYIKKMLEPQIKAELQDAMLPALGEFSGKGVRYDEIPSRSEELRTILCEKTRAKWAETRGIEITSLALTGIVSDDNSADKIRDLQESKIYSQDKTMLGARVGAAQANAMEMAAENPAGAVTGFVGMGMAQGMGGVNVNELMNSAPTAQTAAASGDSWVCECGMTNTMSFCPNCGKKRPEKKKCGDCGFVFPPEMQAMKFCPNCGKRMEQV